MGLNVDRITLTFILMLSCMGVKYIIPGIFLRRRAASRELDYNGRWWHSYAHEEWIEEGMERR